MSRIGKLPVAMPVGVKVKVDGSLVSVEGGKGKMEKIFPKGVDVAVENNEVVVQRNSDSRQDRSAHGLARTMVANMITGVSTGFEKILEVAGAGYRAEFDGKVLKLLVGYSRPVEYPIPKDITIKVDKQVNISVSGYDKELVGLVASQIRGIKKPEPYKGKGIKYANEVIKRKVGKSVGAK